MLEFEGNRRWTKVASTNSIALYLINEYEQITQSSFEDSELRLQKLMYYIQKTALALTGESIIEESFEGWVHGPVLPSLRFFFEFLPTDEEVKDELTETEKYIIDNVIYEYGKYSTWTLRNMTHDEISWNNSRKGLELNEHGSNELLLEDIKKDAENVRIYDHVFDMYLDEFDDVGSDFISVS